MRDLLIWSAELADLAPVKAAKAALDVDFQVEPRAVREPTDLMWADRVLAIGTRPPFLCDYALVTETTSPEGFERALRWVLHLVEDDPKATTILDTLTAHFGPGVHEVTPEEQEARQRFTDYQQNRA